MGFFSPLTEEHLRQAVVPLVSGVHTSPRWADEEPWELQLLHGCRHDRNAGVAVDRSTIASNDDVSIHLDRVGVSPVAMMVTLRLRVTSPLEGAEGIRGVWPWAVSTSLGSSRENVFYLAGRPGDICRFGARYSNGARAETGTGFRDNWYVWGEEDTGSYSSHELRIQFTGHSEGPEESTADLLLYPPPPSGEVELFVHWPGLGIPETAFTLTQDLLKAAGGCLTSITASEEREIRRNLEDLRHRDGDV